MDSLAWVVVLGAWVGLLGIGLGVGDYVGVAVVRYVGLLSADFDVRKAFHREDLGGGAFAAEAG
jgi:hypothetical protein